MADYIDKQDAIYAVHRAAYQFFCGSEDGDELSEDEKLVLSVNKAVCTAIKALPSADVVEVVRCGECKHMTADGRCLEFADDCLRPSASDYCSYGERK